MEHAFLYESLLGKVLIAEDGQGITKLGLVELEDEINFNKYNFIQTDLLREAASQFREYLEGKRRIFTVQLNPKGTSFQRKVWEELCRIPYGETRSYKQIAVAIGNPKACRAVGMANHYNPIMCMIPCHRVIGSDKKLVGYAGGLHIKEQLLTLESE